MESSRRKTGSRFSFQIILLTILIISFCILLFHIQDYGISYDEPIYYEYAERNLSAIKNAIYGIPYNHLLEFYDLYHYGPAYLIVGNTIIGIIEKLFKTIDVYDAWHALNFSVFLSGAWLIFLLSKRFVSEKSSLIASLLYLTQPLLWGHGVMNPKDTPFMVCFLAAVTAGFTAFDRFYVTINKRSSELKRVIPSNSGLPLRVILIISAGLWAIFLIDQLTEHVISTPVLNQVFDQIQRSQAGSILYPLGVKISSGISQGIPYSAYLGKAIKLINLYETIYIITGIILLFFYLFVRVYSSTRWLIIAAVLLGITTSIRILGIAAGGLVFLYGIIRYGKLSVKYLAFYSGLALITIYAVWPYLWQDPLPRMIDAFRVMINFPWPGTVRFEGTDYPAVDLPYYYLPKLMAIQFTLPLIVLFLFAMGLIIVKIIRRCQGYHELIAIIIWLVLPMTIVVMIRPTLYDNFRQLLFITPPIFVFAAIAIDYIQKRINSRMWTASLVIAILLPGIIAGIWLHPYQYVYYNALVGWTGNIERNYENDYWGLSLCEAGKLLSMTAKENSLVELSSDTHADLFTKCADQKFEVMIEQEEKPTLMPDYSVLWTRFDDDLDYYREMKPMTTVQRGKTVFLVIKSQ